MSAKVIATLMTGRDLKPGDLFSTADQIYWSGALDRDSVGESVYIRTNANTDQFPDADLPIYRITIEAT